MINSRKSIAIFTCQVTLGYRRFFCEAVNEAVTAMGYNAVFYNFYGVVGSKHSDYSDYEHKLVDVIPYDQFSGIIFDEESITIDGLVDKLVARIKEKATCPVVSVSSYMKGFYNLCFDDDAGIELMARHLYEDHGCRRIGFLSGPMWHMDGVKRYHAFKAAMTKLGLPEEGAGIFEGDFWYNKAREAAEFFAGEGKERPEAIICANDYSAMALCKEFKDMGLRIPEDVIITGFDGIEEGQEHIPRLTTVDHRRDDIAKQAVTLIDNILKGQEYPEISYVSPNLIYGDSCGCTKADPKVEIERLNGYADQTRSMHYYLSDIIGATLKMNIVESIGELERSFADYAVNFGGYRSFCVMTYVDENGKTSLEKGMNTPTNKAYPSILVDRKGDYEGVERKVISTDDFLPTESADEPRIVYITSMHCGDRCFGYCSITMTGTKAFNEFYYVWIATLAVAMESLLRSNNIRELISSLEYTSIRDGLTGLYNRRGFVLRSTEASRAMKNNSPACAMVIDMDGLKPINDHYGHAEGDIAIKTLADIISSVFKDKAIAGRTGGDEFYVFVPDCTEDMALAFREQFYTAIARINNSSDKPYILDASFGAFTHQMTPDYKVEELIRIADERMYAEKQKKRANRE
ncbi:diguanylate cyclase domain-containing protein [Ruminococcus albus]|uniref:Diguanylate cyclase (GGDEF) domain-containing protein n=1 Tax=Ruminococcus albus TaxID=1264 RepID=A0A1I1PUI9_RUMAL|nr:GGDEF domain-containing protein [Ruminococcus albus]SFD11258.1 diguanylate cyclase (GGDEF) domain-containing protein [Ruminococcus albus]